MDDQKIYTENERIAAFALIMLRYSGELYCSLDTSIIETADDTFHSSTHEDNSSISTYEAETENVRALKRTPTKKLTETSIAQQIKDVDEMVPIGSGRTLVSKAAYDKLKWNSYKKATRSLAAAVFGLEVLATHSLSGQQSRAFADRPAKKGLDPIKVHDVVLEVQKRFEVENRFIRTVITTKCGDECKIRRKKNTVMETELKLKYCNITREVIDVFLSICEPCQLKTKMPWKALVVRLIIPDIMSLQLSKS